MTNIKYKIVEGNSESEESTEDSNSKDRDRYDLKKQTRKSLAKDFVKKSIESNVCIFRFPTKYVSNMRLEKQCYLCSRPGKFKIGIPVKKGYSPELADRWVCDIHRKELLGCTCQDIPFSFAICNYLRSERWCPNFNIRISTGSDGYVPLTLKNKEETCVSEFEYEFSELATSNEKCSICGHPAKYSVKNYKNSDIPYNPTLYFCEKHKFPLGCNRSEVLCEAAPCQCMEKKSDCIFFKK